MKQISQIYDSKADKLYSISDGGFPTVVFGRCIPINAVPGTKYYFEDGCIKLSSKDVESTGMSVIDSKGNWSYIYETENNKSCIFTVPKDFEYSKLSDQEYVEACVSDAQFLNANTTSPNYVIRDGKLICVKKICISNCAREKRPYSFDKLVYTTNYINVAANNFETRVGQEGESPRDLIVYCYSKKNQRIQRCSYDDGQVERVTIGKIKLKKLRRRKCFSIWSTDDLRHARAGASYDLKNKFMVTTVGRKKRLESVYKYFFESIPTGVRVVDGDIVGLFRRWVIS